MKKVLFLSLAASAVLASCSNEVLDSVVPQEPQAISFENAFVDKGTRADLTTNALTTFYVYGSNGTKSNLPFDNGTNVFNGVKVTNSNGECTYPAESTKYWEKDKYYNFVAYSNNNNTTTASYDNNSGVLTLDYSNEGTNDLIFAQTPSPIQGLANGNQAVGLTFGHKLSKVYFTFKSALVTTLKVEIKDLQIVEANSTGLFNGTEWDRIATPKAYTYNTPITASAKGVKSEERYMIPQTNSELTAKFTVIVTDTNAGLRKEENFTVSLNTASGWEINNVYNYTATITSENIEGVEPITFTASVDGWGTTNEAAPEVTPETK